MITLETIPYSKNPELWDQLLANDPVQYPLGYPSDQAYSIAYAENWKYSDISFIVHDDGVPLAGLQLSKSVGPDGQAALDFLGRAAMLRFNKSIPVLTLEKAEKLLAEECLKVRASEGHAPLKFLEMAENGRLSDFAVALLRGGAIGQPSYRQIIDLTHDGNILKQGVRKSYKSLLSWGDQNLSPIIYDAANITLEVMESFRQLHIKVAGRETRSAASWDLQYRQVVNNEAFLILGTFEDELVTGAIFLNSPLFCYYGVGASLREMQDKPLSHAIIWAGILHAKKLGCTKFEMGILHYLYDGFGEKERNIALFKRGFGGDTRMMLEIGFSA